MIRVHRLNGNETVVNAELIESVESVGQDTVLALTTGNKIVVKESVTAVIQLTVEYKQMVYAKAQERSFPCPSPSLP
jgi:uncharacterized protein YlzI (FlbEa/FlbD family)